MNMFRTLLTVILLVLAAFLWFGKPEEWTWVELGGPYALQALNTIDQTRPFSIIIIIVVALALFMTRKQY